MFQFYDDISEKQGVFRMRDRKKDGERDKGWSQRGCRLLLIADERL
jgi:hypothetical protein